MARTNAVVGLWFAVIAAALPRGALAINVSDFVDYSLRDANNQVLLPGRLYLPPEASANPPTGPRPIMIFLHGSGANGTDNLAQLTQVTDRMFTEARDRGAFLYVPQATNTWSSQAITDDVMMMVDRAISNLNADAHRVYLTGYSLGSYRTWTMLSRYDGRFAAAIPLSGGTVAPDFVPSRLIDTPILTMHGRDDSTATVTATRNVLNSILAAAHEPLPTYLTANNPATFFLSNTALPVQNEFRAFVHQQKASSIDFSLANPKLDLMYYEPQLGGHDSLGAFNAPPLYNWLFAHTTAVPEPQSAITLMTATLPLVSRRRLRCRNIPL